MEEKISLPLRQKTKTRQVKWAVVRSQAAKATLVGMACFFVVLSIQNDGLFLDHILLTLGIVLALVVGSTIKSQN